jgi:phage terminase large subunit
LSNIIDLNQAFPEGKDGSRRPLPKQRQFLDALLDESPGAPKYVRYVGGIGSGKTLIGCISMIHMAVLRPGDYLIARQFMPELKDTTYKTFLEVCPRELIAEIRVADMVVKLRNIEGGISTIFFRGLEEPDKLRSMNLNAFYIDEANQVTEAAFLLLQGRLRGKYWRKGFLTMNPGGHDWSWAWFSSKVRIKDERIKKLFLNIRAPSTENVHLPDGYIDTMMATWSSERIKREIMGSEDSFEGMIYPEFDRSIHVIKPFRIPDDWTIRIGMDDGYRNPAAWIYGAICPDGDLYIWAEFYRKEWLIEEICGKKKKRDEKTGEVLPSAMDILGNRKVEQARLDTAAKQVKNGQSNWNLYLENLPSTFPLMEAQKSVQTGIERVKSYMKPDGHGKPRLYIFDTCTNLLEEIAQYKWAERPVGQQGKANEKEEPHKVNDHACDALRYLVMTCPEPTPKVDSKRDKLKEGSLERSLYDELQLLKRPRRGGDPFGL